VLCWVGLGNPASHTSRCCQLCYLHQHSDSPDIANAPAVAIHIRDGPELNGVTEIAMLMPNTAVPQSAAGVVFFATAEAAQAVGCRDPHGRTFVSPSTRFYESLKYPILYPTGVGGWGISENATSRSRHSELLDAQVRLRQQRDQQRQHASTSAAATTDIDDEAMIAAAIAVEAEVAATAAPPTVEAAPSATVGPAIVEPAAAEPRRSGRIQELQQQQQRRDSPVVQTDDVDDGADEVDEDLDAEPAGDGPAQQHGKWVKPTSMSGKALTLLRFTTSVLYQTWLMLYIPGLGQEWILDQFSRWTTMRLQFLRRLPSNKRGEVRQVAATTSDGSSVGRQLPAYLPASIPGSTMYQRNLIDDGMALIEKFGAPTLWITMTANPRWPEILAALEPSQSPGDRPDLIVRLLLPVYAFAVANGGYSATAC